MQKVEGTRKSHRGQPETWDQPRPVLAVLVLAGGGQGRKLARSRVPRSTVLSKGGARLTVEDRVGVCGQLWCRLSQQGRGLWQSWQLLGPASPPSSQVPHRNNCGLGTANARIWSPDRHSLHLHRTHLKGIDSLHSCYIRRGTSLSRSTDSLDTTVVGSYSSPTHPFL